MRRIIIIGQEGSGRLAFSKHLGEITHLPVFTDPDACWPDRSRNPEQTEIDVSCEDVFSTEKWIFVSGSVGSGTKGLSRADTVIWLERPTAIRMCHLLWRKLTRNSRIEHNRPDGGGKQDRISDPTPANAAVHPTRRELRKLFLTARDNATGYHLKTTAKADSFLRSLRFAAKLGNLGISHR